MGTEYKLIILELKKKLTAAQAEKDALQKGPKIPDSKVKIQHLEEVIESLKTQIHLLQ
jgi:hypothetical protein